MVLIRAESYTCRNSSQEQLRKTSSTNTHYITPALVSYLRSLAVRALHRHRKGVGSVPAGGPIVDDVFQLFLA